MSGRTIQIAFKKYFGYSPWTYLKTCRLEKARRPLADRRSPLNVTQVALCCGFDHLSQFATEYRRYFRETPKRTSLISRSTWNLWGATAQVPVNSIMELKRVLDSIVGW